MEFAAVGHFSANMAVPVDFMGRLPWLYVIYCLRDRFVYVGETQNPIERLSTHFGPYARSTLRQAAARVGRQTLNPPFLVVAARLPADDPDTPFDASSRIVRQLCEALVHANLARDGGKWWIISTPQPPSLSATTAIEEACVSISNCCTSAVSFLDQLAARAPFSMVVLGRQPTHVAAARGSDELGSLLTQIEVRLHSWLVDRLRDEFGKRWWTDGVPKGARLQCVSRMEEEGVADVPRHAYLTFIDLRDIIRSNWGLFARTMERMSGANGKDRSTQWLVELNEIRKLWAHPIKQMFLPVSDEQRRTVETLWKQLGDNLD